MVASRSTVSPTADDLEELVGKGGCLLLAGDPGEHERGRQFADEAVLIDRVPPEVPPCGLPSRQLMQSAQETYLRALATLPKVSVHLGVFYVSTTRAYLAHPPVTGPKTVEIIKTEEKGSDVALATYLMLDGCRADCDTAVVITNDSDLREPLMLAREELGLTTGVINPHPAHKRSRALQATFFKQLQPRGLRASQLPHRIVDAHGRLITKPFGW
jgi:hypothetical protein